MKIKTVYFGELEIDSSQVLHFENGLPGFESESQFVLLPIGNKSAFQILQSIQTEQLAFIVVNPYMITTNYNFEIDEATVHSLQIKDVQVVVVLVIVSLKESIEQSTINLKAPIVCNTANSQAKQVILDNENCAIRHQIGTGISKE